MVWGRNGFDRLPERGFAGSLHLVPGQNVQTDAGTVEDDRRVLKAVVGYERIRELLDIDHGVRTCRAHDARRHSAAESS